MPTYVPFAEGDALTAVNINSRLTTMRTWVNALPARSVQRWGLDAQHVPPQTFGPSQTPELFPNGFIASSPALGGADPFAVYDNSLEYTAGVHPLNYQDFSAAGVDAPYGPVAADSGGGWRIPSQAGAASKMELVLDTPAFRLDTYGLALLVRAHVEVYTAIAGYSTDDGVKQYGNMDYDLSGAVEEMVSRCALIGIGFSDGLGNRYVIERTVRWNNIFGVARGVISTSTLLQQEDLAAGNGTIASVFGVVASNRWADPALTSPPPAFDLDLRSYNINILPIR